MRAAFLLLSAAALLFEPVSAAVPRHRWRVFKADPKFKAQTCYPADLLRVRHSREGNDLAADDGMVMADIIARSDQIGSMRSDLVRTLSLNSDPPPRYWPDADDPLNMYEDNTPAMRIVKKIVRKDFYMVVKKNKLYVEYTWETHVDHSFKQFTVQFPTPRAAAWRGVPEKMWSCFRSFGPVAHHPLR